ncbi:exopolysaccharide biosynthesis protein [Halomonas sp. SpR1]|uniref:exopolysaccharide biosynthesis protein n=1 Tax=Halomonas sp. SpR1 TaxID=3050462 RepID=UPI0035B2A1FE
MRVPTPLAIRSIGIVIFIMAVLIALPVSFGNTLPGLAVLILSLGLAQRDGIAVAAGLGLALVAGADSSGRRVERQGRANSCLTGLLLATAPLVKPQAESVRNFIK